MGSWSVAVLLFFVLLEIVTTLLVDTRTETAIEFVGLVFFLLGNFFFIFQAQSIIAAAMKNYH